MSRPLVSVMVPCFNEEGNVEALYSRLRSIFDEMPDVRFEIIFIDNASVDKTQDNLRALAAADRRVKVIFNVRNFGSERSPLHAFFQAAGDAVVPMACDLQDPPELLKDFVRHWRNGFKVVIGIKPQSRESRRMFTIRRAYYRLLNKISDAPLIENFTSGGLYAREVAETLRPIPDRRPYLRGLTAHLGWPGVEVPFARRQRQRVSTK